ncbi:hypothetical protein F4694_000560 [Bacillus niacini]|uniref:Lasso peptide biosynthesis PqqD family chaperone n=2 Tax=Neobacillus TaxID=2675232 RepID=A0A852T6M0_9BACI|nr:hypothetical protein [Neobacillus niacini]
MIKNINISLNQFVAQVEGNIVSNMGNEKVMLSVKNGKYYNLGEIGGVIWDLIEKRTEVNELVSTLLTIYDVEMSVCVDHVISFLEPLLEEGLIELSDKL